MEAVKTSSFEDCLNQLEREARELFLHDIVAHGLLYEHCSLLSLHKYTESSWIVYHNVHNLIRTHNWKKTFLAGPSISFTVVCFGANEKAQTVLY